MTSVALRTRAPEQACNAPAKYVQPIQPVNANSRNGVSPVLMPASRENAIVKMTAPDSGSSAAQAAPRNACR